jgi:hypothetical protein
MYDYFIMGAFVLFPQFIYKYQMLSFPTLFGDYYQGLKNFPKVHWSKTSVHQESTGPEKCSTGPEYRNGGNKIC